MTLTKDFLLLVVVIVTVIVSDNILHTSFWGFVSVIAVCSVWYIFGRLVGEGIIK